MAYDSPNFKSREFRFHVDRAAHYKMRGWREMLVSHLKSIEHYLIYDYKQDRPDKAAPLTPTDSYGNNKGVEGK